MLITVSMGISYGTESLEVIGDEAQNNLDIALVRGGDQVVVKMLEKAKSRFSMAVTLQVLRSGHACVHEQCQQP